jgi:hypothetical protein
MQQQAKQAQAQAKQRQAKQAQAQPQPFLDPKIWGSHFWFVLHTMSLTYPLHPNETTKKKYYDFIQNLPLFLPIAEIGNNFSLFLDRYPVTPYLDSRESFIKWMHFIHNKINLANNVPEMSIEDAMINYYEHYKPKAVQNNEHLIRREKYIFLGLIVFITIMLIVLYNK